MSSLIWLMVWIWPQGVQAQQPDTTVVQQLEQACASGNVQELLAVAADRLEVALLEESRLYSRAQARYVLDDFFDAYTPRRCVLREASRTPMSIVVEGDYWYERGTQALRLYMHLRHKEQAWELREILIEKRN